MVETMSSYKEAKRRCVSRNKRGRKFEKRLFVLSFLVTLILTLMTWLHHSYNLLIWALLNLTIRLKNQV